MTDLATLPIVLHPSRRRFAFFAVVAALFGSIGWGRWEEPVAIVWVVACALSVLLFLAFLVPSQSYLRLDAEGFRFRMPLWGRERFVPWSAVSKFGVVRSRSLGGDYVVDWVGVRRYQEMDTPQGRRTLSGSDWGWLPDPYGMNAERLAALMNDLRQRYGHAERDDEDAV